jgi:type VI secretion system protein ImpM
MSTAATQTSIGYFGKIPARGDFVKAGSNVPLLALLDEWLAQSMDLLSADPRWKIMYDAAMPFHFAFIGPRRNRAIGGHIIASRDQAQRRFPFLMMSTMEINEPEKFVPHSPMIMSRLWNRLETLAGSVLSASDPTGALQAISSNGIDLELRATAYDAAFADFLEIQTVGALDDMLAQTGFRGSVRKLLLALGLLLQPVMVSNTARLEKSLVLPLPHDPMYRYLVAAFWLYLITPFLLRADFEIAIFITRLNENPSMVIGFSGASARTLQAIIDPQIGRQHHILFEDMEWVDAQTDSDYGVKKLSSYLAQPHLSLKSAYDSFREVFIGA